ncbi:SCO3374 family protein [Streptomyces tendae]|uniref:SCO3374 family protein n=1 Tax=Streptomyces tendae TaxID=1932 RepID=UPI0013305568|nr:SCO3374 family protein [Streptomyces tendae]
MVGASHPVPPAPGLPPSSAAAASPVVPSPRRPTENGGGSASERVRWWYESVLGWPTAPGEPVRLRTGVRFDVLDVPADAGYATLERLGRAEQAEGAERVKRAGRAERAGRAGSAGADGAGSPVPGFPVAVRGGRMLLLVAAGAAEELPGLLEWLEWGSLPLDLTAVGTGGLMDAPPVPEPGPAGLPPRPPERDGLRGAAVWLRPPVPGYEVGSSLPALSVPGCAGTALDLARLVHTLATQCHRVRLAASDPPRARPVARVG